jgi:hypothetical protein
VTNYEKTAIAQIELAVKLLRATDDVPDYGRPPRRLAAAVLLASALDDLRGELPDADLVPDPRGK